MAGTRAGDVFLAESVFSVVRAPFNVVDVAESEVLFPLEAASSAYIDRVKSRKKTVANPILPLWRITSIQRSTRTPKDHVPS